MSDEKLGCFGNTWNLVAVTVFVISLILDYLVYIYSEGSYEIRVVTFFTTATSGAFTLYQVYKRKPDGFLKTIKHEFFITRKSISGAAIWVVSEIRGSLKAQTEELQHHQETTIAQHTQTVIAKMDENREHIPDALVSASQAVKRAFIALDSSDKLARQNAIETLSESDDPKAIDALEIAVKHSTKSVRINAAFALEEKTQGMNERALDGLLEALDEPDVDTKERALRSIGKIFHEIPSSVSSGSIEKLISTLRDRDDHIRQIAESVLLSECDKTLPYLIKAIRHDSLSVKIAALEGIWIISCNHNHILTHQQLLSAVPALIEALDDLNQGFMPGDKKILSVSELAEKILIEISPVEELTAYLQNNRTWMHKHVRRVIERIQNPNNSAN